MAPKAEIHEEQVLQAVILAQCEQDYGDPVTQDVPKVLAPLANTPLLEYSLEWLERCGVEEAIVYCRADTHLETIREHCRAFMTRRGDTTPATTHPGGLRVNVVASEDCHSLGDAMRDLYAKSLLKGDFILLQGDTVTTLDLPALVTEHRESRAADRNAIMTCVYMGEGGKVGSTAEKTTTATLLVSASTNKLLLHRRRGGRSTSSRLSVPTELLQGAGDILAYPAAYDPSVTICSEVVPSLFSDNFDYSTLDSLVRGVIEQEELLGYTIKCRVLEGGYAGRAASINSLIGVSGEVVGRQAYPLVPEVSQTSHRVRYHHDAFTHTYWDPSAKFPKGSMVTGVVVGAGTEVSPTAHLQNTTLGDHCTLGDGVVVRESVVMTGVCVKAASKLEQCWVGDNVVLGEGVVVAPGCVIGAGVTLGDRVVLAPGTRLSARPPLGDLGGDVIEPDPAVCGVGGVAYVVDQEEEEEEEEEDEEEEDGGGGGGGGGEMDESEESEEEIQMSDDEYNMNEFQHEVQESLSTALREGAAAENVVLEINASRHAYNVSMEDVLTSVVQGILKAGQERSTASKGAEGLWPAVKFSITAFQGVLRNYVKKNRDQILLLNAVESLVRSCPPFLPLAKGVLFELNQTHEILDDEVIVAWYRGGAAGATSPLPALRTALAKFVEWLEEEEEESEEEED